MNNLREKLVNYCQRLHSLGFLAAGDGNLSFRVSDDEILISPRGKAKAFIKAKDIAIINLKGEVIEGDPSSEMQMHLQVFRDCPKAKAVFHAHPPISVAWSIAFPDQTELPNDCISELILAVGSIPIVPYARPGTSQMGEVLKPFLPKTRVMILARHGALCWGETLMEAYMGMERLEHSAKILKIANELNPLELKPLPLEEIEFLKNLRLKLGEKTL